MFKKIRMNRTVVTIFVLILTAVLSVVFSFTASSPDFHQSTIDVLDNKKIDAMSIYAGATALSTGISFLPDDMGTSIVQQLSEISSYVLLVTCVIFFEKFLLTTAGALTFAILIPFACCLGILYTVLKKEMLKNIAIKLAVFGMVVFLVVPLSVRVSLLIEQTHTTTVQSSLNSIKEEVIVEEEKGFWDKLKDKTTELSQNLQTKMNNFIDAIAVMLITTCAIPIAVLFFMLWVIKMLFGINIELPSPKKYLNNKQEKSEITKIDET